MGDEIEVYLEAKEDSEGLIVLSKDKADKIKVWDAITQAYEKGSPVEGRVVEVVKGGLSRRRGREGVPARLAGRPAAGEEPRQP